MFVVPMLFVGISDLSLLESEHGETLNALARSWDSGLSASDGKIRLGRPPRRIAFPESRNAV
jgi:hypothetical protein